MVELEQQQVCHRYGCEFVPSPNGLKLGISQGALAGAQPIHGLRHQPEAGTTGWYIWAGEELSEEDDFFKPLHVAHLSDHCPLALPYLGLPPGWRFLVADSYEDVWFDPAALAEG